MAISPPSLQIFDLAPKLPIINHQRNNLKRYCHELLQDYELAFIIASNCGMLNRSCLREPLANHLPLSVKLLVTEDDRYYNKVSGNGYVGVTFLVNSRSLFLHSAKKAMAHS